MVMLIRFQKQTTFTLIIASLILILGFVFIPFTSSVFAQ